MAFPSNSTPTASSAFQQLTGAASMVRAQAVDLRTKSLLPVPASVVLKYLRDLRSLYAHMQTQAVVPGVEQYAKTQYNNPGYDIAAEFLVMSAQMLATVQWIAGAFPKDAGGYLLAQTMDANGVETDRVFQSVDLAGLRTQLDALAATVMG